MASMSLPAGMVPVWTAQHMVPVWTAHGPGVNSTWSRCEQHMVLVWTADGLSVEHTWSQCGTHMVPVWNTHGPSVECTWSHCGRHWAQLRCGPQTHSAHRSPPKRSARMPPGSCPAR
eukprot:358855-Chlamydomonas_euryale.AAC.4